MSAPKRRGYRHRDRQGHRHRARREACRQGQGRGGGDRQGRADHRQGRVLEDTGSGNLQVLLFPIRKNPKLLN